MHFGRSYYCLLETRKTHAIGSGATLGTGKGAEENSDLPKVGKYGTGKTISPFIVSDAFALEAK